MGHAIHYCATCRVQIKDQELVKGGGFRIDQLAYCKKCAPAAIKQLPPDKVNQILDMVAIIAMEEERPKEPVTKRVHPAERAAAAPPPSGARSALPIAIAAGAVALISLVLVVFLAGSGRPPAAASSTRPPEDPPKPPPEAPRPDPKALEGGELLRKAREFARLHPDSLKAQLRLFEDAAEKSAGTPLAAEAAGELEALRTRIREAAAKDLAGVLERVRAARVAGDFAGAARVIEEARPRHPEPEGLAELDRALRELARVAEKRLEPLVAEAIESRRKSAEAHVAVLRSRVAGWGFPTILESFDRALAAVAAPPTASQALARARTEALALAAGRDFTGAAERMKAVADPDAAADAEAFRLAGSAYRGAVDLLLKTPAGQKLEVEHAGGRAAGTLLRADAQRLWLKEGEGTTLIYPADLPARALAEQFLRRPGKAADDERAALALCVVDGDAAAGRRFWGDRDPAVPARLEAAFAPVPDPRDAEARALFQRTETEHAAPATAVDAARTCEKLLRDYAATAVVRRLRAVLEDRAKTAGHEYVLWSGDLAAGGSFRAGGSEKVPAFWVSAADGERKDAYVEAAFSARADLEYRVWAYVGGCCAETLAFGVQASELASRDGKVRAEPGGEGWLPPRVNVSTASARHATHGGRKQPARWGWAQLPPLKYASDGLRKLRLVTDQEGFAAACVLLSSVRTSPPTEAELKKLSEAAAQTRAALAVAKSNRTRILCYHWSGAADDGRDPEVLQLLARRDPKVTVDLARDTLDASFSGYDVVWFSARSISNMKLPSGKLQHSEITKRADDLRRFVEAGGIVWSSAQDDDSFSSAWLPAPVSVTGGGNATVKLAPGLGQDFFSTPHKIDPPKLIAFDDSWKDWNERYEALGTRESNAGHGTFLLLRQGKGCYVLTAVATLDAGRDEVTSRLFENALHHLLKLTRGR